jgi:hypothetical protein
VNSAIKELRNQNVRLITTGDLIGFSREEEMTIFPAVKVEHKGNGAELSFVKETLGSLYIPFRDVVLDRHGTIRAAAHVLCRRFRLERIGRTAGFGIPMWNLTEKFPEDSDLFDLWIIAHWEEWNLKGLGWKSRHSLAEEGEASIGRMQLDALRQRCRRMGLEKIKGKSGTNRGALLFD